MSNTEQFDEPLIRPDPEEPLLQADDKNIELTAPHQKSVFEALNEKAEEEISMEKKKRLESIDQVFNHTIEIVKSHISTPDTNNPLLKAILRNMTYKSLMYTYINSEGYNELFSYPDYDLRQVDPDKLHASLIDLLKQLEIKLGPPFWIYSRIDWMGGQQFRLIVEIRWDAKPKEGCGCILI